MDFTEDTRALISLLCKDFALQSSFPDVQKTLLHLYESFDNQGYSEIMKCKQIGESMRKTCEVLLEYTDDVSEIF